MLKFFKNVYKAFSFASENVYLDKYILWYTPAMLGLKLGKSISVTIS